VNRRLCWWIRPCHPRLARQDLIIESFIFSIFGAIFVLTWPPSLLHNVATVASKKFTIFVYIFVSHLAAKAKCALFFSVHHLVSHVTPDCKVLGVFLPSILRYLVILPPAPQDLYKGWIIVGKTTWVTWPKGHYTSRFQIQNQTPWYSKPLGLHQDQNYKLWEN